jgi:hypothetical protein
MPLSRKRFYIYFSLAVMAGFSWLALVGQLKPEELGKRYDVCLIRHFAHIPCPSCGSTRSVISLMHGDLTGGFYWNPIGFLIFTGLVIAPFWIGYDLILKKDSLYRAFLGFENTLRNKWVAIPAIILLIINWIWNIYKGV